MACVGRLVPGVGLPSIKPPGIRLPAVRWFSSSGRISFVHHQTPLRHHGTPTKCKNCYGDTNGPALFVDASAASPLRLLSSSSATNALPFPATAFHSLTSPPDRFDDGGEHRLREGREEEEEEAEQEDDDKKPPSPSASLLNPKAGRPEKRKRPPTAQQEFIKKYRPLVLEAQPSLKMREVTKVLVEMWEAADAGVKAEYEAFARRRRKEREEYKALENRLEETLGRPKKPPDAYGVFEREQRAQSGSILADSYGFVTRVAGKWRQLPETERARFAEIAAEEEAAYQVALKAWRAVLPQRPRNALFQFMAERRRQLQDSGLPEPHNFINDVAAQFKKLPDSEIERLEKLLNEERRNYLLTLEQLKQERGIDKCDDYTKVISWASNNNYTEVAKQKEKPPYQAKLALKLVNVKLEAAKKKGNLMYKNLNSKRAEKDTYELALRAWRKRGQPPKFPVLTVKPILDEEVRREAENRLKEAEHRLKEAKNAADQDWSSATSSPSSPSPSMLSPLPSLPSSLPSLPSPLPSLPSPSSPLSSPSSSSPLSSTIVIHHRPKKPRRTLTAQQDFMETYRPLIREAQPSLKTREVTAALVEMWEAADTGVKAKYEARARRRREEHRKALAEWRAGASEAERAEAEYVKLETQLEQSLGKPKKPANTYDVFVREQRAQGDAFLADSFMKHVAGKWHQLPETERARFAEIAAEEEAAYDVAVKAWRATMPQRPRNAFFHFMTERRRQLQYCGQAEPHNFVNNTAAQFNSLPFSEIERLQKLVNEERKNYLLALQELKEERGIYDNNDYTRRREKEMMKETYELALRAWKKSGQPPKFPVLTVIPILSDEEKREAENRRREAQYAKQYAKRRKIIEANPRYCPTSGTILPHKYEDYYKGFEDDPRRVPFATWSVRTDKAWDAVTAAEPATAGGGSGDVGGDDSGEDSGEGIREGSQRPAGGPGSGVPIDYERRWAEQLRARIRDMEMESDQTISD